MNTRGKNGHSGENKKKLYIHNTYPSVKEERLFKDKRTNIAIDLIIVQQTVRRLTERD